MRAILFSLATLGLISASFVGCTKESKNEQPAVVKQTQVSANKLLDAPLLRKLPAGTVGFLVSDLSGEGYQKFKRSPWYNDMPFDSALNELKKAGADGEQQKLLEAMMQLFTKLGTISPDGKSLVDQVLSSIVVLANQSVGDNKDISVGAYASAAGATNLKEKLPVLKEGLKELGASIKDDQVSGAEAFVASLALPSSSSDGSDSNVGSLTVYVAASDKLLGVSHKKALVENLFATTESNDMERIRNLPEFQKVELETRGEEYPLAFSFVSTKALLPLLDAAMQSDQSGKPGEPNAASSTNIPVEALALSQGVDKKVVTRGAASVNPKTDTQKMIFDAISEGSLPSSATSMPVDTAVALALDTKAISKLGPLLEPLAQGGGADSLAQLKTLQGLTLGIRNSDAGSPIPEVMLTFDSKERDALAKTLEGALSAGMAASGQQAMWMSKDIAGAPARYFTTLLGIGIFIAKPTQSESIVVATSERAIKDAIGARGGAAPALKALATADRTNGAAYVNFTELANVIDSAKSSLAMFTGGASDLDKALDSQRLRKLGLTVGSFGYRNGILRFESALSQTPLG